MKALRILVGLCIVAVPLLGAAQERGALLVATGQITDEAFGETAVLLLHFGADGAIGVAINRPTWVSTREVFPERGYLHRYRGRVFHGGPLAQATVLVLRRTQSPGVADSSPLVDDVYMSSDLGLLEAEIGRLRDDSVLRFYAGHASWRPGQLEEEIEAGAWRVLDSSASIIFDPDPATLWSRLATQDAQITVRDGDIASPERREGAVSAR
ncbi:MAG TPA: YqgE/AlgH family protein [Gammaproteobacteria bacterium]|nr:YqgE/AlgH family protein [Gammaproteobacteria bacterium]